MSKNMQRFGAALENRMKKTARGATHTTIELGVVNSNLSITTDSLRVPIPRGDYMVNLAMTGGVQTSSVSMNGTTHSHSIPSTFRGLQAGDRVLVAWCGNEPVVIAIVVGS